VWHPDLGCLHLASQLSTLTKRHQVTGISQIYQFATKENNTTKQHFILRVQGRRSNFSSEASQEYCKTSNFCCFVAFP